MHTVIEIFTRSQSMMGDHSIKRVCRISHQIYLSLLALYSLTESHFDESLRLPPRDLLLVRRRTIAQSESINRDFLHGKRHISSATTIEIDQAILAYGIAACDRLP